jgi:hypothetical protein
LTLSSALTRPSTLSATATATATIHVRRRRGRRSSTVQRRGADRVQTRYRGDGVNARPSTTRSTRIVAVAVAVADHVNGIENVEVEVEVKVNVNVEVRR